MSKSGIPERFDVILAVGGIGLGVVVVGISEYFKLSRSHFGIAFIVGCSGYLVIRNWLSEDEQITPISGWKSSNTLFVVSFISFLGLLSASIWVLTVSLYSRPPIYFGIISAIVILLIAQIAFLDLRISWKEALVLAQILLLGISFKAGAFFLYSSVSGNDPFVHQRFIDSVIQAGVFPKGTSYSPFPIMHLIASGVSLISGKPSEYGLFFISITQSFGLLAIFCIGKELHNSSTGLIAALLLSLSDFQLQWGVQIIPNGLGVVWFLCILLAIVKRNNADETKDKLPWTILILIFLSAMIFTHTISTLVALVTLGLIKAFEVFANYPKFSNLKYKGVGWSLSILFTVSVLTYWMWSFPQPGRDFLSNLILSIRSALASAELGSVEMVSMAGSLDPFTVFSGEAGWTLILMFAILGILSTIKSIPQQGSLFVWVLLCGFFLIIVYASGLMGMSQILPSRWLPFLNIFACLLAAIFYSKLLNTSMFKPLLVTVFLFFLSATIVLMITSPIRSAPDSPLYAKDLIYRPGFYSSEIAGMQLAEQLKDIPFSANSKYRRYLYKATVIDPREPKSYENAGLIVVGVIDFTKGFFILFPKDKVIEIVKPTRELLFHLLGSKRVRMYDSGSIQLYISPNDLESISNVNAGAIFRGP